MSDFAKQTLSKKFKSSFLKEFEDRGFFAQSTHIEELDEFLSNESVVSYIGFDCTAKTLHAGSLIQIMILRLLQKHGHKPVILLGGATTKIGDPTGKDEARKVLNENEIAKNLAGIKATIAKFVNFEDKFDAESSNAFLVNNDDWLKNKGYLEILSEVGRHFSINRMLTFDSVKLRLEREQSLSFLEFNYMILQAYDFYHLNKTFGCRLQIGGSDQWGNIVNGVELTRRIASTDVYEASPGGGFIPIEIGRRAIFDAAVYGLTSPLLTTADGKKMGKTADGAVWLDAKMLSPFDYFQYFRNTDDRDVGKFLKLFTDLDLDYIKELEQLRDAEINKAKEVLAYEATKICHGEEVAKDARNKAREIFVSKNSNSYIEKIISYDELENKKLIEAIKLIGASSSNSESKKLIEGKAVYLNDILIEDIHTILNKNAFYNLRIGKKKFFKLIIN